MLTMTQDAHTFLQITNPIFDVRSPAEFLQGHIPGAHSLPIFSNEERALVGTVYKQEGKEAAVSLGLDLVGPKLRSFVTQAKYIAGSKANIRVYCWRGGMRSSSMAWLLETAGFTCQVLSGGYKTFRRWTLDQFQKSYYLIILDGLTGSGKTEQLQALAKKGEQVIDLENIAKHRGSSFGHLGLAIQPSSEQFENILAYQLSRYDPLVPIWIENESRTIGKCYIPQKFKQQMTNASKVWVESTKEDRTRRLILEYGSYPADELIVATRRLVKKLGGVRTEQIVGCIERGEVEEAVILMLEYYDKAYLHQ